MVMLTHACSYREKRQHIRVYERRYNVYKEENKVSNRQAKPKSKQSNDDEENPWRTKGEIEIHFSEEECEHPEATPNNLILFRESHPRNLWGGEQENDDFIRKLTKKSTPEPMLEEENKYESPVSHMHTKCSVLTPRPLKSSSKRASNKFVQIQELWEGSNNFCCFGYLLKGPVKDRKAKY